MKIGMQFAMPAELHALPGAKDLEPFETVSGVPFYQVAPDIIACASGISKVNAAMGAEILCLKYGVDLILNAGVAGCATDLATGSLVVPTEFIQHDVDTTAIGDPVGLVSTVNRVTFPTWEPERCAAILKDLGFTAGVGENSANQRLAIASGLEFMGVKMDAEANNVRGKETVISAADSKVKVLLIPTNEELMIAMDTAAIVKG